MRDYFCIGPTPSNEDCAQVGQPNYREKALEECARFIRLLREKIGPEPEGAWLSVKWFEHDFGPYCEVVCYCNSSNSRRPVKASVYRGFPLVLS
jgi:hypothetical protein